MKRHPFPLPAVLAALICGSVFTPAYAESEVDQAVELLRLALDCQADAAHYNGSGSITNTNKLVGNSDVLRLENRRIMKSEINDIGFATIGTESEDTKVIAANYSDLEMKLVKEDDNWSITLNCKQDNQFCISVNMRSELNCEIQKSGPDVCDDGIRSSPTASSSNENIFGLCPDQIENIKLSLELISKHFRESPDPNNYRVVKIDALDGLAVRDSKSKGSEIVGVLPSQGSGVLVSTCDKAANGKRGWCRVEWGNISGWAASSHLAPKQN